MRYVLVSSSVVLAAAVFASAASAADYRIGVVNALKVLEAAPQAESSRKIIEKEFAARDRQLVEDQKALKTLEDRLAKDGAIMSEGERGKLERDILHKKRDLKRDQDEFREDYNFRRNEELGKIQREVAKAIQGIGKAQNFDLILSDGVIFASDQMDVTGLVLEALKKQFESGAE